MKNVFWKFFALSIALFCAGILNNASAQTYQIIIYPPTNFDDTQGLGIGGEQRVGTGRISGFSSPSSTHALLWLGNSTTPIDLHPSNSWTYSSAKDTNGTQQGGYVEFTNNPNSLSGSRYAAVWNGTPQSFIQLCGATPNPLCGYSEVLAVGGDQQVGYYLFSQFPGGGFAEPSDAPSGGSYKLAALWNGTPESFTKLHPRNINGRLWSSSKAVDTDGVQQVGNGVDESQDYEYRFRGLLWTGTRDSFIDLSPPNNIYNYVYVNGVKNNVQVGYGYIYSPSGGCGHALVWHGTAESYRVLDTCASLDATNGTTHVGSKEVGYYGHAFRWDEATGASFDLHTLLPEGVYRGSVANRIDEAGNIIGTAQYFDGRTVGVLWRVADAPNIAPQISLTSPGEGSYSSSERLAISANAQDSDGSISAVEFYVNGINIGTRDGTVGVNEFSMTWLPRRVGVYTIQAKAVDNLGASTMSAPVTVRIRGGF